MLNIIKSDFYRIFRGKALYITILVIFATIALSLLGLSPIYVGPHPLSSEHEMQSGIVLSEEDEEIYNNTNSILEERSIMKKYPFPLDNAIIGVNSNLYYFFIVIIVLVLSVDFTGSTAKNTISSAISRKKYYISKLVTALLLCTILILINNFGTYFANIAVNGKEFSSSILTIIKATLFQIPLMYGIISLLVCICNFVKRTAIFNTITIPFLLGFQLVLMAAISVFKIKSTIFNYEFQVALENLANNPTNAYIIKCALIGLLYIAVFNTIGYFTLKKSEIK